MTDVVKENLEAAQKLQKWWYDKTARECSFNDGQQVLVLLPMSSNKLIAQWQGPYRVVKKISKVTYQIDMHDRRKCKRTFHVNMLRKWYDRPAELVAMVIEDKDFEEVISGWRQSSDGETKPALGEQLNEHQKSQLNSLLEEFSDVFRDSPCKTDVVEHCILTGSAGAVRLPPYRIPHAYRETVKHELEEMLQNGTIEPAAGECRANYML